MPRRAAPCRAATSRAELRSGAGARCGHGMGGGRCALLCALLCALPLPRCGAAEFGESGTGGGGDRGCGKGLRAAASPSAPLFLWGGK